MNKPLPDFKSRTELLYYALKHKMDFDIYKKLLVSLQPDDEKTSKEIAKKIAEEEARMSSQAIFESSPL